MRRYLRLFGGTVGVLVVGMALGYYPTLRAGGSTAVRAMLAGGAVALFAGALGTIPLCSRGLVKLPPADVTNRVLIATALRLVVALAVTLSVALSGWFKTGPLLVWVAIGYLLTLTVETVYVVGIMKSLETSEEP